PPLPIHEAGDEKGAAELVLELGLADTASLEDGREGIAGGEAFLHLLELRLDFGVGNGSLALHRLLVQKLVVDQPLEDPVAKRLQLLQADRIAATAELHLHGEI